MWGGRFAEGPAAVMREINASIPFDKRMWRQDLRGSLAHAAMLGAQGIVSAADAARIGEGLAQLSLDFEADGVPDDLALEDIHMLAESRLADAIGPAAGRLHTARSRNDQVATDFRLWVRDAIDQAGAALAALQNALLARAEEHADSVMPGFTHLQVAQPVTLGHHLMAYFEMLGRDRSRFADARARMNLCPLGSAALGRHRLSDRPRRDRGPRSASTARRAIRSIRSRTAISRSITSPPPRSAASTSAGSPRSS